ncbi:signal peptidase I [Rheinheimera baltica]|uniref:signal peptidase I n=1 Tax=Rheinheimera baltica TaxID=67576 RepID=UPI00273E6CDD|nr:signal peptidase I [Rheinheimera baltica]MDP5148939.1 signal peptidase I [Rheinheimera baltica]
MYTEWKPNSWIALLFGLLFQPFVFLYVNRPRYFFFYIALTLGCIFLTQYPISAALFSEGGKAQYWPYAITIACAIHAYILSANYDVSQKRSWWAKWWTTLLSVIAVYSSVVVTKTFFYDVYSIPAASMSPALNPGDHVVVSKHGFGNYSYAGIPVLQTKSTATVQRGDIVVFRKPENETTDFIKRVIAGPGDKIYYLHKRLYLTRACDGCLEYELIDNVELDKAAESEISQYQETLDRQKYQIQQNTAKPDLIQHYFRQQGMRSGEWLVPAGHYFVMGDNRDNSLDSRYWGFVPEQNIVGKAVYIF